MLVACSMCVQYCLFSVCLPDEIHEVAAICRGLTKEFAVPGSNFERWYKSTYTSTHTYSERASAIIHTHVYVCRRYMYIAHMYAYVDLLAD